MQRSADDAGDESAGRRGRWRSGRVSRQKILDAARRRFAVEGYQHATVRAIAADAGVDPSMIHYFFGGKDRLFAAAMELPRTSPRLPVTALFADGVENVGPILVRRFLEVWDATSQVEPLLALARDAARREQPAAMLREFIEREFVAQIVRHLDTPDAPLRAALVSAQLFGLAIARYAMRLEPVASASHDVLVARLGPLVQDLLTGRAGGDAGCARPVPRH